MELFARLGPVTGETAEFVCCPMLRTVQQLPLPSLTSGIDVLPGFLRGPKSDRQRDTAYSISNKINVQAPDRVRTPDRQGCLPWGGAPGETSDGGVVRGAADDGGHTGPLTAPRTRREL